MFLSSKVEGKVRECSMDSIFALDWGIPADASVGVCLCGARLLRVKMVWRNADERFRPATPPHISHSRNMRAVGWSFVQRPVFARDVVGSRPQAIAGSPALPFPMPFRSYPSTRRVRAESRAMYSRRLDGDPSTQQHVPARRRPSHRAVAVEHRREKGRRVHRSFPGGHRVRSQSGDKRDPDNLNVSALLPTSITKFRPTACQWEDAVVWVAPAVIRRSRDENFCVLDPG